MTFAEYFVVLRRHWRTWFLCLLAGILAAVAYNAVAPTRYTAVSTSFVTVAESASSGSGEIFQGSQFAVQRVKSYASLSSSPQVLDPVIRNLQLDTNARDLAESVEVTSPPETVLLKVSVTAPDPVQSARIANEISTVMGRVIEELETPRVRGASLVKVSLTQPAEVPMSPSAPRVYLDLLLGAVSGSSLGLVAALIKNHVDRRVDSDEEVKAVAGVPTLGSTLPLPRGLRDPLVALDHRTLAAERYRSIRSALRFGFVDKARQCFVVSSSIPEEGKTTVAANLAISWAQAGASVCLVEADLRRPATTQTFGLEADQGFADVLVGSVDLEKVLLPWHDGLLTVLPAGSVAPDPTALLGSVEMEVLAEVLQSRFDVVIYDAPAIVSVTDAVVLTHVVGGLVLVVRSGYTSRDDLQSCVDMLRESQVDLLGTIRTGVKLRGEAGKHYANSTNRQRAELSYSWTLAVDPPAESAPPLRQPTDRRGGAER